MLDPPLWQLKHLTEHTTNGPRAALQGHAEWLDDNCGVSGWSMTPAGTRGVLIDAVAVYVSNPTCAMAFVARWLVPGDPSGFYELRHDEPAKRVPVKAHSTPC